MTAVRALLTLLWIVSHNVCFGWAPRQQSGTQRALFSTTSSSSTTEAAAATRNERVRDVLQLARALGPVGVRQSQDDQQKILDAALELQELSDPKPASVPLSGIHNLLYSAAPGGSSGKLGPLDGKVSQEFVDESTFINAVQVGPVKIALTASREIKNDTTIAVKFHKTAVSVFGQQVLEKETGGGGVWKLLFVGTVTDTDGSDKLVRVMQTPSLFVIEQPIAD